LDGFRSRRAHPAPTQTPCLRVGSVPPLSDHPQTMQGMIAVTLRSLGDLSVTAIPCPAGLATAARMAASSGSPSEGLVMVDSSWFRRRQEPAPVPEPVPAPAEPAPAPAPEGPAVPRGERIKTVAVRLTPDEHAAWVAAAAAEGRGQMGRWVRETVTARLENRPVAAPVSQAREMRAELARMGSNLNQIAKALNIAALGGAPAPETEDIGRNLEAARELLGSVRDELRGR
jgi:pyruvate/2-oxoglutarate dehydrogenase complex dihydrolipoamide acyltransferase (E2) component